MKEDENGTKSFDPEKTINPLTGKPIQSWYKPGETYAQVFGACASSLEECRAQAAAMYLVFDRDILMIFGHTEDEDIQELQYATYLVMGLTGLRFLEYYDVAAKKHMAAETEATMGLLNCMIQGGIAKLAEVRSAEGTLEDLVLRVSSFVIELALCKGQKLIIGATGRSRGGSQVWQGGFRPTSSGAAGTEEHRRWGRRSDFLREPDEARPELARRCARHGSQEEAGEPDARGHTFGN
jgi:hypothetical protein